jgi:hypothetical protein
LRFSLALSYSYTLSESLAVVKLSLLGTILALLAPLKGVPGDCDEDAEQSISILPIIKAWSHVHVSRLIGVGLNFAGMQSEGVCLLPHFYSFPAFQFNGKGVAIASGIVPLFLQG